jgi:hypothetical protein
MDIDILAGYEIINQADWNKLEINTYTSKPRIDWKNPWQTYIHCLLIDGTSCSGYLCSIHHTKCLYDQTEFNLYLTHIVHERAKSIIVHQKDVKKIWRRIGTTTINMHSSTNLIDR